MMNVVPFTPQAPVEFEQEALQRITLLSALMVRTSEVLQIPDIPPDLKRSLEDHLVKVQEQASLLEAALEYVEDNSASIIADMTPGKYESLDIANDEETQVVSFTACTRCNVIFISKFSFKAVRISYRQSRKKAAHG